MSDSDAERIMALEEALAFQEKLIHDLDLFVRGFQARLDKAEREVAELKLSVASAGVPFGPADETPPHY